MACLPWAQAAGAAVPPTLAAASDLRFALEELTERFARERGVRIRQVYGSSGQLHAQILQGAPFHLFLSADEEFVFRLFEAGLAQDRGRIYGTGRIGILVPHGSPLKADGQLKDLAVALADGRLRKFAIANPEHAPYGMRAREALQHAGLWDAIRTRLVHGENVSQAAQFAVSGAAQGGIVALSLALAPEVAARGAFDLIAEAWHRPLAQRMVLLKHAPPVVAEFHAFLAQPAAQAVMSRYGFTMPKP